MRLDNLDGRRERLRVYLVAELEQQRKAVESVLAAVEDPPLETMAWPPDAGIDHAPAADVAMVIFGGNATAALSYLQTQSERPKRPVLIALLPERSPALMRGAMRAGADEVLFLPLDPTDLTRELLKICEKRRASGRGAGGRLYSVTSLAGGVGVTSLTANLALALHRAMDQSAALVDLDLQNGGLGVYLHLGPERNIVALNEIASKLDSIKLEAALARHSSGVYLLAAPKRIEDADLVSDVAVGAVLDLMRQLFEYVLVDCGRRVNENLVAAWERSDQLLYVIDQSVSAARTMPRFMDLFRRLGLRGLEPKLVLNKSDGQGLTTIEKIEELTGAPVYARIPRDDWAFERVQLGAEDLRRLASGSALTRATEMLARRLVARGEAQPDTAGGFMTRLLSAFSGQA